MVLSDLDATDFDTPVLLCVFNRPDLTKLAIEALRSVRPKQLYVSADGPRDDRGDDVINCQEVRESVQSIDWPCDLRTRFLDQNHGCGRAVSSAIDWFFDNEEEGIILEDDTLPVPYFFCFAQEMLKKFRYEEQVFMVSGTNMYSKSTRNMNFFFSRTPAAWGWATWRRAWNSYDFEMLRWRDPAGRDEARANIPVGIQRTFLSDCFDDVVESRVDTWDYQWMFNGVMNAALGITSGKNLITNVGVTGTHSANITKSHFLSTSEDFRLDDRKESPTFITPLKKYDWQFVVRRQLPLVVKRKLRRFLNVAKCFIAQNLLRGFLKSARSKPS
jgi:hypothetical protein